MREPRNKEVAKGHINRKSGPSYWWCFTRKRNDPINKIVNPKYLKIKRILTRLQFVFILISGVWLSLLKSFIFQGL